jgi:hypothetical protein
MTVREHLAKFHSEMSKCHVAAADKSADCAFHKAAAAVHDEFAEACAKAASDDLNKIQPLPQGLSYVAPTHTAVPRAGQKPIAKADVDEEFAFLAKVQTGDGE